MLVYKCDICKEEGTMDTLRRFIRRLGFPPRNQDSRVWEVCESCEQRLLGLLGEGREWRSDTAPAPVGRHR